MRSRVLAPMEPVAPSSVTVRSALVGADGTPNAPRPGANASRNDRGSRAGDRSRPGLFWAHLRQQLCAADGSAEEIPNDVSSPYDREKKKDCEEAIVSIGPQDDRRSR